MWCSARFYFGVFAFLIYINDLTNALAKFIVHYFADDTNLLYGNKNPSVISAIINSKLKLVVDWLRANKFPLNECKTNLLLFRPINKLNLMNIYKLLQSLSRTLALGSLFQSHILYGSTICTIHLKKIF